ncbi:Acyl-CoA N-acyltransferase [Penicillium alfredii]|uniref:Acyl-CoA N-acyltransferase n=1 Tax=Penicillium alfredii TaxID=1506179 RepID=A0A9W9K408_9EURO|nr:Acyl-CoA N-acyltransferase [Penicillium alfredii]KAJ5091831.1 Acyl-CoA N-acyltransferase [Penicillium alfredii]
MAFHYTYSYFRVSKTEDISASAQRYRELRLKALKTSPSSFSSTYDIEAAFTHADWIDRLTVPNQEVFICAATRHSNNNGLSFSEGAEWIGQVTLRGPLSATDFVLPEASGQPPQRPDEEEERWQMLSLFTLPEHRGKGLGGNLCQEALDFLRSYRASPPAVQVRLMVKPDNHATVKLYLRLGFVEAGKCTLAEALVANGDGHLLPKDPDPVKYADRQGLIMISRISRP